MRLLSEINSPLPSLAIRSDSLTDDALVRLNESLQISPRRRLQDDIEYIVDHLNSILFDLSSLNINAKEEEATQKRVIDNVELLMHRISSVSDYFGRLFQVLLPSDSKKNKKATQYSARLDHAVETLFKVPINKVKHDSFSLQWIEFYTDHERTHGFVPSGPIDKVTTGPASFRYGNKAVSEGYSYAYFLREAFEAIYKISEIAEEFLSEDQLFQHHGDKEKQRKVEIPKLPNVIAMLNGLPIKGFPNEHGKRISEYVIDEGAIWIARTHHLTEFRTCRITYRMGKAEAGQHFKMPYWN